MIHSLGVGDDIVLYHPILGGQDGLLCTILRYPHNNNQIIEVVDAEGNVMAVSGQWAAIRYDVEAVDE